MKIFLTSNSGGFNRVNGVGRGCEFNRENGLYNMMKEKLPNVIRCICISSNPNEEWFEINDSLAGNLKDGFLLDGFCVEYVHVCDYRNADVITKNICDYNVIFLAGGHVPTQNKFLNKINLGALLKGYKGVIIGRSAGSMNCSDIVYAQPELVGEAINTNYKRYLNGLGLTDINILPHFEEIKDDMLDGLEIVKDICLPDSKIRPFYALTDKSFIYLENGIATLFGEGYLFKDGGYEQICDNGGSIKLS